MPWDCEHERHGYEKSVPDFCLLPWPANVAALSLCNRCQYDEYVNLFHHLHSTNPKHSFRAVTFDG